MAVPKRLCASCRTLRKGTKTLIWDNAETLLFKAVMDSDLAYYLERQMAPVSESLDQKVSITSVRIAKQTGGRNTSTFGGAPTRTMLHRYKFSKRVDLLPGVQCPPRACWIAFQISIATAWSMSVKST